MIYSIEFIRLVAVVLITLTHLRHNFTDGPAYVLLEVIPLYGTLILSVVSGYLFGRKPNAANLFSKKVRSLLIPFLIANAAVLIPVLLLHGLGYDILNRLNYDFTLLTEGLLALNSAPINPPTYFIRDLFVIFVLIELVKNRNLWMLAMLIPLALFGKVMLRYDILFLFATGFLYSYFDGKQWRILLLALLLCIYISSFFEIINIYYDKHILSIIIFILLIDLPFRFRDMGGYTYLLHLYHSPVIVISFPLIHYFLPNPVLNLVAQFVVAIAVPILLYQIIRRYPALGAVTGNRVGGKKTGLHSSE